MKENILLFTIVFGSAVMLLSSVDAQARRPSQPAPPPAPAPQPAPVISPQ